MVPKHQNETLALLRSKDPSSGVGSGHLCFVTSSPRASWLRPRFRKWGLLTPSGLCVAAGGLQPEGRWGGCHWDPESVGRGGQLEVLDAYPTA